MPKLILPKGTKAPNSDYLDGIDSSELSLKTHHHDGEYINAIGDTMTGDLHIADTKKIIFDGGWQDVALDMKNKGISGVGTLRFNDPGPGEGIMMSWSGTNYEISLSNEAKNSNTVFDHMHFYSNVGYFKFWRPTKFAQDVLVGGNLTVGGINVSLDGHKHDPSEINTDTNSRFVSNTQVSNWDDAYSRRHDHGNKTVLDATTASFTTALKTKLDNISSFSTKTEDSLVNGNIKINGAESVVYTHPGSHDGSMINQDGTHRFVTDSQISSWNAKSEIHTHPYLSNSGGSVNGSITIAPDGEGINFYNGPKIYKKVGSGLKIKPENNTNGVAIQNVAGSDIFVVKTDGSTDGLTFNGKKVWYEGNFDAGMYNDAIKDMLQNATDPPRNMILNEINDFVQITFTPPATKADLVNSYEVWSSVGNQSNFGMIAAVEPEDTISDISIIDNTYAMKGTVYYKIFSVSNGVRSTALEGGITVTNNVVDPANMQVIADLEHFIVQYELPEDRRLSHVEIYKDAQTTLGALNQTNAVLVYSGVSNQYVYKIPQSDLDKYHQFWVSSVTRG